MKNTSEVAVEVKNIKKYYGEVKALDGVSLRVDKGKIYGLLGPNGAGKTTVVRTLATLIEPDSGEVTIGGLDVVEHSTQVRRMIGLAGQFAAVDDYLTGRETLMMVARLYHVPKKEAKKRADELLRRLSLQDAADRPAKTYSGGMRRRLDLGASLVGKPEILFLDEPTTGLDPRTRQELWGLIRELVAEGRTLLLTTQYLEEADALCDYISIIDRGKVVKSGTASQLKSSLGRDVVELQVKDEDHENALKVVRTLTKSKPTVDEVTKSISIRASKGAEMLIKLVNALDKAKIKPTDLAVHRPSLDDVFLAVTGKKPKRVATKKKKGKK
ncbi:MAG: ATP-binding cassette protein [Patescibacteria group bacterium]|jgi:ABC-2 type transport system ATP-binding protein|nr:ATP-binding cassette protein [Patescibacteria group bacterium]